MTAQRKNASQDCALAHLLLTNLLGWNKRRHAEAFDAFDKLVKKGCDSWFLVSKLAILARAHRDDTWEELTGFADPRILRTALKRMRYCADDVEKLLAGAIGKSLFQTVSDRNLPTTLRTFADRLEPTVRAITPRRNVVRRAAQALIVRHVKERTTGYRDDLVARILSPALGQRDAVAQGQWRRDQAGLIAIVGRA